MSRGGFDEQASNLAKQASVLLYWVLDHCWYWPVFKEAEETMSRNNLQQA